MWEVGKQYIDDTKLYNVNDKFKDHLKGALDDHEAAITLCQFLRQNLSFTYFLLTGGEEMFPYQEIMLKAWFIRNFNLNVWGRGCSKSWLFSVFCWMYPIFYPDTKIVVVSSNFRSTRRIFEQVEKFTELPNANLLRQCLSKEDKVRRNDQFSWKMNGGALICLPLSNGDGLRGTRANVLGIDELLLLSESVVEEILKPFLAVKQNVQENIKLRRIEDQLIAEGQMTEDQRLTTQSTSKIIGLSSASYQFEHLYTLYQRYLKIINDEAEPDEDGKKVKGNHFVSRLSYQVAPPELLEESVVEEARNGGTSNAAFQREYMAMFTDDSQSYFSVKAMEECTHDVGDYPCVQMVGDEDREYILTIDPSYSQAKNSDFFAMNVSMIDRDEDKITLVHSYGVAGGKPKNHANYLKYLLQNFNIVLILVDTTGGSGRRFIEQSNDSELFKQAKIDLQFIETDLSSGISDPQTYVQELKQARNEYNLLGQRIVYGLNFNKNSVRAMNEHLQLMIDKHKVWFASSVGGNDTMMSKYLNMDFPALFFKPDSSDADAVTKESKRKHLESKQDFIEQQDFWIVQTKKQCALIDVKTTAEGNQTFDLPQHLKRSTNKNKARKDNYTCLLLGAWGWKLYKDIMNAKSHNVTMFTPQFVA